MKLSNINEVSTYKLKLPSTGKTISYRPFLVKEQKILLTAMNTGDENDLITAMLDTVRACTDNKVDLQKLAVFDIDYIFTQIRSKSVGETSDISIKCEMCNHFNDISVPLEEIKVEKSKTNNKVNIMDKYEVTLRYLNYEQAQLALGKGNEVDVLFEMCIQALDKISTEEEVVSFDDEERSEIEEFMNNLTPDQFDQILEFVQNTPTLKYTSTFNCKSCEHENRYTLSGIQDFF